MTTAPKARQQAGAATNGRPIPDGKPLPPEAMVSAAATKPMTPGAPLKTSTGKDELVRVNVPKKYNFVTPDHHMHTYAPGEQNMRRSIAEASYSIANGVTIIGDAE